MLKSLFLKSNILLPLFISVLFSAPVYLYALDIDSKVINSFLALLVFYKAVSFSRERLFWFGFFAALFWFWWLALPMYYWGLPYLAPLGIVGIGAAFGAIFYTIGLLKYPMLIAVAFLFFSYLEPLAFNWLIPELIFTNSYFGVTKLDFALILGAVIFFTHLKKYQKIASLIPLIFALDTKEHMIEMPNQKIYLAETKFSQFQKWDRGMLETMYNENMRIIDDAITRHYDIVVLPEGAFHIFLDEEVDIFEKLKDKSHKIAIITGAFFSDGKNNYNSSYLFYKGKVSIANKVVLAPFGERVPLPQFFKDMINDMFYDGAKDFGTAKEHTDFEINGEKFRSAVCYEATHERLFEGEPKYMIAISNNALFAPSIEPYLQRLLMKFHAKKFSTTIFHSANYRFSGVVTP